MNVSVIVLRMMKVMMKEDCCLGSSTWLIAAVSHNMDEVHGKIHQDASQVNGD
jgi:hypothetical protein